MLFADAARNSLFCKRSASDPAYPKPSEVWPIIERLLAWMRVKGRHYWLLQGHTGFDTLYRGSVMTQESSRLGQHNFATYGRNLIVRPLDQSLWLFDPTGTFKGWSDLVKELYRLRGKVAHSGKLSSTTGHSAVDYLFATNAMFAYCREQRIRAGAPVYSYPAGNRPFEQLIAFKTGEISVDTNTAMAVIR